MSYQDAERQSTFFIANSVINFPFTVQRDYFRYVNNFFSFYLLVTEQRFIDNASSTNPLVLKNYE